MDYHEIRSLTLVRYNKELYGVWDDDWDERSARLLPLDSSASILATAHFFE